MEKAKKLKWQTKRSILATPKLKGSLPPSIGAYEPIDYFRSLLRRETIENMVDQSNLYAIQSDPTKPLNVTYEEMEKFIDVCFYMSVHGLPQIRLYWNKKTRVDCVANVMPVHRRETVKRFLHIADNHTQVPAGQPGHDKLFKVRPFLNSLLAVFKNIPMDQMLCVDEMMIPFKGKSIIRQYLPK